MKKKKNRNELGFVYDNMMLNVGVIGSSNLVGKLGQQMPSPVTSKINRGMETMSVIPTVHMMGGIFGQLNNLNKKIRR